MASAPKDISDQLKDMTISSSQVQTTGKSVGREIGRGAYGRVFTVKYCGLICAAKEIHSLLVEGVGQQQEQSVKEGFLRECQHCSVLNHPNIVRFMGIYYPKVDSTIPVMIMELMDESLRDYMKNLPKNAWMKKGSILLDVAEGLSYLHAQKPAVVHRDLSPNNILLKAGKGEVPVAKIGDLGVAKIIKADSRATQSVRTKVPGTVDFMPPESFEDEPVYGVPLDVFSYGGIMLFVATHRWPMPTAQVKRNPKTNELVARSEIERRQKYLDEMRGDAEWLKPLVESCLSNDPSERPTMSAVSKQFKESLPLVPALQSGCYELTWEKCADLPAPLGHASAVLHNEKVHVMATVADDDDTLRYVFTYDISSNHWDKLPPPGHIHGELEIIDGKLSMIGGAESTTKIEAINKVSTFINNSWTQHYPNMSKPRIRPGVATYSDYVIVAGGGRDMDTCNDDIELLYYKQSPHWIRTNIKLPEPMCLIALTISDDLLYIAGYSTSSEDASNKSYKISVDKITSSVAQLSTSSQTVQWTTIPSTPHYYTAIIPNSCPPVIIGGSDRDVATADVAMLKQSWSKVASLPSPRDGVAVVPINCESILVIGGGNTEAHCLTKVEKGTVKRSHTVAAIPTQDTQCIIQ